MAHKYNAAAVQSAIDSQNRRGGKNRIGGREAKLIHALLRGREPAEKGAAL